MTEREQAESLAQKYVLASGLGGRDAARIRDEIAEAPQAVSDLVADYLARKLLADEHRSEICAALANRPPAFFRSGRARLVAALAEIVRQDPAQELCRLAVASSAIRRDADHVGLGRRIASVFKRAWVIVVVGLPVAFALLAVIVEPSVRLPLGIAVLVVLALAILVDAKLRACPSCRRWLAGLETSVKIDGTYTETVEAETSRGTERVQRTSYSYKTSFRCVHCKHRWTK